MSTFPFMDYLEKGIKVTLNTDDMGVERTTLANEYRYMEENHGLTGEQERTILLNAINGAFTSDEVKNSYKERQKKVQATNLKRRGTKTNRRTIKIRNRR